MITTSFIFFSLLIFWSIILKNMEQDQYPLIIVNGKKAPRLSPLLFHTENKTDLSCMSCHANNQNFIKNGIKYQNKKMPHEYRENCTSCHILDI
jgi:hypothetical protein